MPFKSDNITIFQSALYQTNSVVIGFDRVVVIVDPCWLPGELGIIREFVDTHYPHCIKVVVFTHADYDHIIGYHTFSDAIFIASEPCKDRIELGEPLKEITDFYHTFYIEKPQHFGQILIDHVIKNDNQTVSILGVTMIFKTLSGHTNDGIGVFFPSNGVLIIGDYLSDIECPWIEGSINHYKQSLDKLLQEATSGCISICVPGHGQIMMGQKEMFERIKKDNTYFELLENHTNLIEIKRFIYRNYSPNPKLLDIHANNISKLDK